MVICVRTDLGMSKGKMCAQACHACLGAYLKGAHLKNWFKEGQPKIAVAIKEAHVGEIVSKARFPVVCSVVRDAGRTQVQSGTITAVAVFGPIEEVDKVTGSFRLL